MAIPTNFQPTALTQPSQRIQFVDANGFLTSPAILLLQQLISYVNSSNRAIPTSSTGVNVLTLTLNSSAPLLQKYLDYEIFTFLASDDSTGAITATVVPQSGTLATLKVYKDNGGTQAGAGDILAGRLYSLTFANSLDTGTGGFILK